MSSNKKSPRTPEFNNPTRRSFNNSNNSPFTNKSLIVSNPRSFHSTATPLNSPSDFLPRRRSIDRNGVSMNFNEEQENEKEKGLKYAKIRSSSLSKGTRSFMAPTISAASKIINTHSPRTKILAERNETSWASSVSFPDENSLSDLSKDDSGLKIEKIDGADLIPKSPQIEKVSDFNVLTNETESLESSTVQLEKISPDPTRLEKVTDIDHNHIGSELLRARFKISPDPTPCYSSCPISAQLDADPHPPPYDPKTNYLSPRPQFLRYRPIPHVRTYLNKECFTFEGFSDTETSEATSSEDSLKESEDASSVEILEEHDSGVCEEELAVGAQLPENTVELNGGGVVEKSFFERRSKSISLLLILAITCLSAVVTDTPLISSPMFKQNRYEVPEFVKENFIGLASKFKHVSASSYTLLTELIGPLPVFKDQAFLKCSPYEIAEYVKENFDGLASKFRFWSANSISSLIKPKYIPTQVHEVSVRFYNLTDVQDDHFTERYLMVDMSTESEQKIYDRNEFAFDIWSLEGQCLTGYDPEETVVNVPESEEELEVIEQEVSLQQNAVLEVQQQVDVIFEADVAEDDEEIVKTEFFMHGNISISVPRNTKSEDLFSEMTFTEVQDQHMVLEEHSVVEATQQEINITSETEAIEDENPKTEEHVSAETTQSITSVETSDNNNRPVLILISLLTTLSLVSVGFFYAKRPTPMKMSSSTKVTGVHDVGNGDSEMSSSFSSYNKNNKNKRSSNRESIGTSSLGFSTDSPSSYGSFTTYEKIQLKQGEEEITTPVRRSSRIRSQITSPVIMV